jgi:hypothetical protein
MALPAVAAALARPEAAEWLHGVAGAFNRAAEGDQARAIRS